MAEESGGKRAPRALIAGASGTIGRAAARAIAGRGFATTALIRPGSDSPDFDDVVETLRAEATDAAALEAALSGQRLDAVVSCLASRTGAPADAWAVDHQANLNLLNAAKAAGARRFVLLSAICVQKPRLAFQHAKLAFEAALQASGLDWTIVRPTAYFKSLSGQVARVRAGKPFLLFGDGRLTATKPISDDDLGRFLADCLDKDETVGRILPVGGPGPAITPREQGERLFEIAGREPNFKSVPPGMLRVVTGGLSALGTIAPPLKAKAELARIGHYYATQSMLVWDEGAQRYDAEATPEYGAETLFDYYERLLSGEAAAERGAHAVF